MLASCALLVYFSCPCSSPFPPESSHADDRLRTSRFWKAVVVTVRICIQHVGHALFPETVFSRQICTIISQSFPGAYTTNKTRIVPKGNTGQRDPKGNSFFILPVQDHYRQQLCFLPISLYFPVNPDQTPTGSATPPPLKLFAYQLTTHLPHQTHRGVYVHFMH